MKLEKKRRIENKTNYKKRLILLKSKIPRLVVRKTNRYLIIEIIESKHAQDYVESFVSTKELLNYGWPKEMSNSLKSVTAGYLAGLLIGKKTKIKEMILDSGLIENTKGSRVYAVVKGISDAGIKIPYKKEILPDENRIQGKHLKNNFSNNFNKIKEKIIPFTKGTKENKKFTKEAKEGKK